MKEEVLRILTDHGTLIEPDAVNFILSQKDPKAFIKDFLDDREALPLVLSLKDFRTTESVLSYIAEEDPEPDASEAIEDKIGEEEPEEQTRLPDTSEDCPEDLEKKPAPHIATDEKPAMLKNGVVIITDITGNSTCEAKIDNFARYFKDRYITLHRIIKQWQRMRSAMPIQRALKRDDEVRVIGMINEIGQTKNGHTTLSIEDDTGKIDVLIVKGNPCQSVPLIKDEVVGIIGQVKKRKGGARWGGGETITLFPDDIIKPDIPVNRRPKRAAADIDAIFISDIHVGSSHFLGKEWDKFSNWLNEDEQSRIKYMVVAGDLVDGIGIYPNQEEELDIPDIIEQYATLGKMLEKLPSHMEIIVQPGNHDAVRPAEPQPALDDDLKVLFKGNPNIRFVGNPCFMTIEGVSVLSYHGRSVDDLIGDIPQLTYQTPILAMKEMLKRRHMAPTYGGKTPIAPEDKDYMVINPVPDIFVTGHVHGAGVDAYREVMLINASAWQSQTPFQLMHNFHPDPAKAITVNLSTGLTKIHDFNL